jgi:Methyltransferase domain
VKHAWHRLLSAFDAPGTTTPSALRGTERDYRRYVTIRPASRLERWRRPATQLPADAPIRPIRRAEFMAVAADSPYHAGRWTYMSAAGSIAADLIARHRLRSALELGPRALPLIVGADVMDLAPADVVHGSRRVVAADATRAPWPFAEREFDLFVALQVFEHLGSAQPEAFREVRRVARHALISLPIEWRMADRENPHYRIPHERALSWFNPVAPTRVELGNPGPRMRLIYVFEDMPEP